MALDLESRMVYHIEPVGRMVVTGSWGWDTVGWEDKVSVLQDE